MLKVSELHHHLVPRVSFPNSCSASIHTPAILTAFTALDLATLSIIYAGPYLKQLFL
jgi:hypothetical protein